MAEELRIPKIGMSATEMTLNEWMFGEAWGVDVAVSTPRLMTALVEEAVSIGDLVRLFTLQQGQAAMVEFTLPETSPLVGTLVGDTVWPPDTVLTAIILGVSFWPMVVA